jgi:hypothetical protein
MYRKIIYRTCCILALCTGAVRCGDEKPSTPSVVVATNYFAKVGQTIQVDLSLSPPSKSKEEITMDPTWGAKFSQTKVVLGPGERKSIKAAIGQSISGLVWIHAAAPGYDDSWIAVMVDFEGVLKLSSAPTLSYKAPTTLSVTISDKTGKPLRLPAAMQLRLTSRDGQLSSGDSGWKDTIDVDLLPGSQVSPQFQLRPMLIEGGSVHLAVSLLISDMVLAQDEFSVQSDPALWLPVILAIMGGLLHGLYKSFRLLEDPSTVKPYLKVLGILATSTLAGLIGYLFAHLDLLGLKLDPNLLRSYPLVGFLFSYFGFEVLIPKGWATKP